ncbi:MAG: hypothetical protein CM15mP106_4700 [Candidatus Neomarinimicrobiota bacterium]|nr:MAG: hypothetical protein CM15mP106_4700 [Candidatus Neomarinimicrobiota bacterium]
MESTLTLCSKPFHRDGDIVHGPKSSKHSHNLDYIDSSDVKSYTFAGVAMKIKFICGDRHVAKHFHQSRKTDWYNKLSGFQGNYSHQMFLYDL